MIKKLREIYSSLITYKNMPKTELDSYKWFISDENQIIGIAKSELTDKDTNLLSTFLKPHNITIPEMTATEEQWYSYINKEKHDDSKPITYRLIFFSFQKFQIEPAYFKEAINEFFAKQVPILWENDHEGIIVEVDLDDAISYEQIIDVLMSDLYVKINFFVGPYLNTLSDAKKSHRALIAGADTVFFHSEKAVTTYIEAIPFILLNQTKSELRAEIIDTVLGETAEEEELLKTIETFISCNLNVSVTAKELYMHRNSLQYRLDKFTEKTGIDIRQFHQAVTVYLALLGRKA